MKFPQLVITSLLITVTAQISFPSANRSQIRPMVDPYIPFHDSQNSVADTLTISAPEVMEPLVRAWADDLILRHPNLTAVVMIERSKSGLATLLAHQTKIAALPRRITRTEISEFILEYGYEPTEVPVAGNTLAVLVHADAVAHPVSSIFVNADLSVDPPGHMAVYDSNFLRRNLYLYIAKPPASPPTQALVELVRYALSQQGQQKALDLGHSPLSLVEITRVTSRWSACCRLK
jgi:ABC-type phosphate transport system substrate-binding protein